MKVRFNRSGQTVLNGKHVTSADVCTVSKTLGQKLIDTGAWVEVIEPKASANQDEQEEK